MSDIMTKTSIYLLWGVFFKKIRAFSEEKTLFLQIDNIRTKNMEKQALNRIKVMLTERMLTNKPT